MIDIVYILGKGSTWDDNEIRYSLRSMVENFKFDRVFVVGDKPDWMAEVIHIPTGDEHSNKLLNARDKYLLITKSEDVSEDFILMNDDFFLLKFVDKIPNYSRGTIEEQIKKHKSKSGYYFQALKDTFEKLVHLEIEEPKDFEVHAPIIFNKEKLHMAIHTVGTFKPYLLRSIYGNLNDLLVKKIKDFKVDTGKDFNEELAKKREFLSITNSMISNERFRKWLKERFPVVSRFENDGGEGTKSTPGQPMSVRTYFATQHFEYAEKSFYKGQLIDARTMKELKKNPKMRYLWVLK